MLFKHISFRKKIFIIIFTAILIPTITVSTIIYMKSKNAITNQTEKTVTNSMNFVIGNIDYSLKAINEMSNSILMDTGLTSIINPENNTPHSDKVKEYTKLFDLLSLFTGRIQNRFMLSGIDSYYLYVPNENIMIDSKSTYFENVNTKEIDFLQHLNRDKTGVPWFLTLPFEEGITGFSRLKKDKLITYDQLKYDNSGKLEAALAINVDTNLISYNFNKIQTGTLGEIIAVDKDGNLISHSDNSIISQKPEIYKDINLKITDYNSRGGSFFRNLNNRNYFIIYSISSYTNWRYIVIIPSSEVLGQVSEIKNFLIIVISIAILMVLGITYLLSYIFYQPLERLVLAMQKIENRNLDIRIDDNRGDEYHKVYKGFNNMVIELNSLIKDLVNEKLLNKEAQIKLLQAQINPHFLYNTLESINSIAKIKKVEEISSMVTALSKFFRISISGGKDVVTLREALDLAINYLTIQNIRFNGKIDYEIDIPVELLRCIVPKLILQPIVENSIYHGLEKQRGGGKLTIAGRIENNNLLLSVVDNGIGIPEEELLALKVSIESDNYEDSKNFALRNLNHQVKLKYGQSYGVVIDSRDGIGTSVYISVPKILK